jgi:hypothetical protein
VRRHPCEERGESGDIHVHPPLPGPSGPDAFQIASQRGVKLADGGVSLVWFLGDGGEQDLLEVRIDLLVPLDARASLCIPRPLITGQQGIEHGSQREEIRACIGRLVGHLGRGIEGRGRRTVEDPLRMPGWLIRRFEIDNPDDWAVFLPGPSRLLSPF